MIIKQFLCGVDNNYGVILHYCQSNVTIAIDAPDFWAMMRCLNENNWQLNAVFLTHYHHDHSIAISELWRHYNFCIYAPALESQYIPFIHKGLHHYDSCFIGNSQILAIETPGHSPASLCYYLPQEKIIFVGDTLFTLGCGRVEKGAYEALFLSLRKIRDLAKDTIIYCGHDYSYSNVKFALTLEPENLMLQQKKQQIEICRAQNSILPPSTLQEESTLNPFLRWDDPILRKKLHMERADDLQVFTALRQMRDHFRV